MFQILKKNISLLAIALMVFIPAVTANELDDQLDNLKKEMLSLGKEIKSLESVLLYPSKSKVSIYLTMDKGQLFKLEQIKLFIDDSPVLKKHYNQREISGLEKGASQRLFVGNFHHGFHRIYALIEGKGPNGRKYKRGVSYEFEKLSKALFIEISINDDAGLQRPEFKIEEVG